MRYFVLATLFLVSFYVAAQKPLTIGVIDSLVSKELSETRFLNIYLPDGYHPDSSATYPVVYLLDGSAHEDFMHMTGLMQFFALTGEMQPAIVVGIANVDRKRDFTFPTTVEKDKKDFPTTGHSEKFIRFIENELQPYIASHYKVNDESTLVGQSLGGLLATEILLKKPHMFHNYIIVSPSLWWDNESLLNAAAELQKKHIERDARVFIAVGNEEPQMMKGAGKLAVILRESPNKKQVVDFVELLEEDHLTVLHAAAYKGLKFLVQSSAKEGKK